MKSFTKQQLVEELRAISARGFIPSTSATTCTTTPHALSRSVACAEKASESGRLAVDDTPHLLSNNTTKTPPPLAQVVDLQRLRVHLMEPVRTHWDGCIYDHTLCALRWALDEIEHLQSEIESLKCELWLKDWVPADD